MGQYIWINNLGSVERSETMNTEQINEASFIMLVVSDGTSIIKNRYGHYGKVVSPPKPITLADRLRSMANGSDFNSSTIKLLTDSANELDRLSDIDHINRYNNKYG